MTRAELDRHLRETLKDAQAAYRKALAAEVRGDDPKAHWQVFHAATAALLLASFLFGSREAVTKAKIPERAVRQIAEEGQQTFDRMETGIALEGFGKDYLKPVADWFRGRVPISRATWETLVEACRRSAGEIAANEGMSALNDIRKRSPILNGLMQGTATVSEVVKGTFFVTGMTAEQTRQTRELLARVIEERPGKSTVGKWIRKMNLGDFVTTVQAVTGTSLTSARLETVLRTNTSRASTEGLAETLREPKVQAFVPLVEYSATGDRRTRPTHLAMDGYVGTMEMFDRHGIAPPCGFNCRCSLIPVPAALAASKGWTDADGNVNYRALTRHNGRRQRLIDGGQVPDPGFVNA